jgi:phosphatidylglycerophosphatase A
LPDTWQTFLAGFVLFRLFDILKPYPIRLMDQKLPGGFGVVMDDVAAGIVANLILQTIFVKTLWLGVQWSPG